MVLMKIAFEVEVPGLGEALRLARESAHISLVVAGDRAGMSGANFNRIEKESQTVPLETLVRAAKAVGVDITAYTGDWIRQVPGVAELLDP